jgi:hypothetical protein
MENKKPKKDDPKPKKRKFNPDVIPVQAKTYATMHRTLGRGARKS